MTQRRSHCTAVRMRELFDRHPDVALTKPELLKVLGVVETTLERATSELRSEGYLESGHLYWKATPDQKEST